jgi:Ser/Thr protein kinase RdoA (MazF antagonist)
LSKFYPRDADARRVDRVLRALAASDCQARGGPAVSRVFRYYAPRQLLLLSYEAGESVGDAIAHDSSAVLYAVGRALAVLHATRLPPGTLDRVTPSEAVLDDLRPRLAELLVRFPDAAETVRGAVARLERDAPSLPGSPALLHGDFGPTNLLWRGAGRPIVMLDFDKCAYGDPALDLGNLLAQLRRMTVRVPHKLRDFAPACTCVLGAYRRWASLEPMEGLELRLAWYERAILLRKVHRLACNTARHPDAAESPQREGEARRLLHAVVQD